jgi:anti-sigma factor RsiW
MTPDESAQQLTAYLLGRLAEDEAELLEDRYFVDPAAYAELQAVEDELIDAYVRGELPGAERAQFERLFLPSAARRNRIGMARHLNRLVQRGLPRSALTGHARQRPWRQGLALIAAGCALGILYWATGSSEVARDSRGSPTTSAAASDQRLAPQVSPNLEPSRWPPPLTGPESVAGLTLRPLLRGVAQSNRLVVYPSTARIHLEIELEIKKYKKYDAVFRNADDQVVWRARDLQVVNDALACDLEAQRLPPGAYTVTTVARDAAGAEHSEGEFSFELRRAEP